MEDVGGIALEPTMEVPRVSLVGTAARTPCPAPSDGARVCVEGSAFVLGRDEVAVVPDARLPLSPERVVRVTSFVMDRDEVTVRRYREALARGFVAPEAVGLTEGPLGDTPTTTCSFSTAPEGREDYALSCVPWVTARAFCRHAGGDLPTEAEWEYAATAAARPGKTEFPWGDDSPTCADAVYGRLPLAGFPGACEATSGRGPRPIVEGTTPVAPRDLSPAGVRGLAGGVSEWTRDVSTRYDGPCWSAVRAADPVCEGAATSAHVVRGGAWAGTPIALRGTGRLEGTQPSPFVGFRCVYRGAR
jgi:formylglycine-generating enzyme required for sulfatase activity